MSGKSLVPVMVFVLALVQAGMAQVDPDLLGWWRLDEGKGTTAADLSRYGNPGTLIGGPKWVAGKIGGGLEFDGINDYVRCAERVGTRPGTYPAELMPATFTVACWTKLDNFSYFSSFVGNGIDTGDDECGFFLYNWGWIDENEKDFGLAIRTETAMNYVESPNIYEKNTWYHVAATYDGANVNLYVNGVLVTGPTAVGGPMRWISGATGNYPERFTIGVWMDPGYKLWVDGVIDDVRYYGRALETEEVKALMTAPSYYPFAYGPVPKHGTMVGGTSQVLQWGAGDSAVAHEVYFGDSLAQVEAATPNDTDVFVGRLTASLQPVGTPGNPCPQGLVPGRTYWWRVDEVNDADPDSPWKGTVWSFQVQPLTAWKPYPPDGMRNVDPNQDLSWEKGLGALFRFVYFGESFDQVNNATSGGWMSANTTYDPGPLKLETRYFWRVDESAGAVPRKGPVWSFATRGAGGGVKAEYFKNIDLAGPPALTQTENAIDHAWGGGEIIPGMADGVSARWTTDLEAPFTEAFKIITTSDDGVRLWFDGRLVIDHWTDHAAAGDVVNVNLVAGQVYSIRMEYYENVGDATAQLSWESASLPREIIPQGWLQLPVRATGPFPAHATPYAPQDVTLRWLAGAEATHHDVYFGADANVVAGADTTSDVYRERLAVDTTRYDPGPLEWGRTYWWRVDEVNPANAGSPWQGVLWSFTTADFVVVDDFEGYTDEEGTDSRIYETWIDGYLDGSSGSTVGYINAPFAEQKTVHSGFQSMPLDYNNVNAPYYSEAERTWAGPQDWTVHGVDTLTLYFCGKSRNAQEQLYVTLADSTGQSATVVQANSAAACATAWTEWKIPLRDFTGVNAARIKSMTIGLGDRDNLKKGGAGLLFIDDIRVTEP
jgi:hypothetical protein